jgi:hypothetical protein
MDDEKYTIGYLVGKLEAIHEKVQSIDKKVEALTSWKWKVIGGSASVAAIIAFIFNLSKVFH